MLKSYLNQDVTWTPAERNADDSAKMDSRGRISYLAPVSIKARKSYKKQEILTPDQQVIKVTQIYYVTDLAKVDDLLDGRRVQYVEEWIGLAGTVEGYKVML